MAAKVWNNKMKQWERRRDDANAPFPSDIVATITSRVGKLNERERAILFLRLGIDSIKVRTLPELALKYGISRHRIGQIEKKACKKLGVVLERPAGHVKITGVAIDGHEVDTQLALRCIGSVLFSDTTLDNGSYI